MNKENVEKLIDVKEMLDCILFHPMSDKEIGNTIKASYEVICDLLKRTETVGKKERLIKYTNYKTSELEEGAFLEWGLDSEEGETYTVAIIRTPEGKVMLSHPSYIEYLEDESEE